MLGVDTSGPLGGVALYDAGSIEEERGLDVPLSHAEQLFPLLDQLLRDCALEREAIDAVCVHCGPGSFTGLRIGLAAMKGFCQAIRRPLMGVDGSALLRSLVPDAQRVVVLIHSRRDLYYGQWFSGVRPKAEIERLTESEVMTRLRSEQRELLVIGSGVPQLAEQLASLHWIATAEEALNRASPLAVAKYGLKQTISDQLMTVEPLYVEPFLARGAVR